MEPRYTFLRLFVHLCVPLQNAADDTTAAGSVKTHSMVPGLFMCRSNDSIVCLGRVSRAITRPMRPARLCAASLAFQSFVTEFVGYVSFRVLSLIDALTTSARVCFRLPFASALNHQMGCELDSAVDSGEDNGKGDRKPGFLLQLLLQCSRSRPGGPTS